LRQRSSRQPLAAALEPDGKAVVVILERTAIMFIGAPLLATTDATTYYTPWFPRGGDALQATIELLQASNIASISVYTETKNSEDVDNDAKASSAHAMTSTNSGTIESWKPSAGTWDGALELVRFKIVLSSSSGLGFAAAQMLTPAWVTN
jgi:hypothetical protein